MSSTLTLIEGKLTALRYLERPDQECPEDHLVAPIDPEARKKTWGYWFTHSFVPIAAALTGNTAAANSLVFQQTFEGSVLAKIDAEAAKIDHPSRWSYANTLGSKKYVSQNAAVTVGRNGAIIEAKLPVEVEVDGKTFRGVLGGQRFQVGEEVAIVVDKEGRLFAIAARDRRYMAMDYSCGDTGFAGLVRSNYLAWKWVFIGMNCFMLPMLVLVLWTHAGGFSNINVDLILLLGMPLTLGVMLALIVFLRLSWSDWVPAWRTSAILHALGRPDLCKCDFVVSHYEAVRNGEACESDIGTIYYASQKP